MRPPRPPVSLLSSAKPTRLQTPACPHLHHRPRQSFHSTPPRPAHHKPKHKSISHAELQRLADQNSPLYKPYTDAEKTELAKRYNPEQMAAIEAGEAAISVSDLATQAKIRRDPLRFQYLDDFSRIEPTIDKKVSKLRGEGQDYENATDWKDPPNPVRLFNSIGEAVDEAEARGSWELNPMSEDGADEDGDGHSEGGSGDDQPQGLVWIQDRDQAVKRGLLSDLEYTAALADPANKDKRAVFRQFYDRRLKELEARGPLPYNRFSDPLESQIDALLDLDQPDVAPDIPKIDDPTVRWAPSEADAPDLGIEEEGVAAYTRVAKAMGQSLEQLRRYRVKVLVTHRVVNQTRLGKISSMYFLCVAGNGQGLVGIGEGKAAEGDEAKRVAQLNAIRNMVPILRYENRTVYGEVTGKSGAVEVRLSARQPGFGVRTSEKIFEIARCAGLHDLQAKVVRKSRNPMNVAKAVWAALRSQRDPEEVARARGRKLVDVRKVYYSGLV